MGFVHNTQMSQFIPPTLIGKSAGTWTPTLITSGSFTSGSVTADVRSAADAAFNLIIPVRVPSNAAENVGAYLKSVDVFYTVTTAALDGIATVDLLKIVYPTATGTSGSVTGSIPSVTVDTSNDTTAERLAIGTHTMTVTLATPVWVDNDAAFNLVVAVDAAATSAFHLHGARANFTLRV